MKNICDLITSAVLRTPTLGSRLGIIPTNLRQTRRKREYGIDHWEVPTPF